MELILVRLVEVFLLLLVVVNLIVTIILKEEENEAGKMKLISVLAVIGIWILFTTLAIAIIDSAVKSPTTPSIALDYIIIIAMAILAYIGYTRKWFKEKINVFFLTK